MSQDRLAEIRKFKKRDQRKMYLGVASCAIGAGFVIFGIISSYTHIAGRVNPFYDPLYVVLGVVFGLPLHIIGVIRMYRSVGHEFVDAQVEAEILGKQKLN